MCVVCYLLEVDGGREWMERVLCVDGVREVDIELRCERQRVRVR